MSGDAARLGRRPGPTTRRRVVEHAGEAVRRHEDRLVTEEPLELRLTWPGRDPERAWLTMRTPGHDFELAAGWALHEGLLSGPPSAVAYCTDADLAPEQQFNVVTLRLPDPPARTPGHRHAALSAGSSACGVCGADSLEDALTVRARPWDGGPPDAGVVRALPERLRTRQQVFDRTGGAHAAGLADAEGRLLVVREDVGRHNAVDKVAGARLLAGDPVPAAYLVVSARAGFELVQKAVAAGHGALVAVGAPTSLAADLAERAGLALFGFTAPGRTVRYA